MEPALALRPALPRRAGRRTNLALLGLLLLAFVTGVLAYGVGTPTAATVVVAVHGAAGLGLSLLVPWKAVIVRRSWPRAASTRGLATGLGVHGTGLGLFLARGLLVAMGGRIWVESKEGQGSTFVFELPAAASGVVEQVPEKVTA